MRLPSTSYGAYQIVPTGNGPEVQIWYRGELIDTAKDYNDAKRTIDDWSYQA